MGTVYLAVRSDDAYQKRVAIKVLKRGMDTEAIVRRFRNERQILASLEHPYIASLIDGGTTPEGLPYFAMEYVEGQTIVEYCEARQLDTTARLQLFRKICTAVQYAHQNLIIHRDIKPQNVLVAADGTPKLLDFGIAKLLNPELGGQTLAPTAAGPQLMTPEYASPEQVRGLRGHHRHGRLLAGRAPVRAADRTPAVPDREPHAGRNRTRRVPLGACAPEHGGDADRGGHRRPRRADGGRHRGGARPPSSSGRGPGTRAGFASGSPATSTTSS